MLAHVLLYDYDYIAYFSHQNNSLKERSIFFFFIDLEQLFVVFCSQKLLLLNPRMSRRGGGGGSNGTPIGFLNLSSNRNEIFSTCSLIMSTSFDVNWMTLSLIIYA